jgi:hypothetical protein
MLASSSIGRCTARRGVENRLPQMSAIAVAIATHATRVSTISRNGNSSSRITATPLESASFVPRAGHDFRAGEQTCDRRVSHRFADRPTKS